jgi:hypothetical protein
VGCDLIRRVETWRVSSDGRELTEEQVGRLEGFAGNGAEARVGLTDTRQGLYTVNAVSRRWSEAKVTGVISGPDSRLVRDWHTIEVRGAFPNHRLYKDAVMKRVTAAKRI